MEQVIKLAIEGGYDGKISHNECYSQWINRCLLSPLFWQALGKQQGWKDTDNNPHLARNKMPQEEYMYHWHNFIDHIADGKSVDSFFELIIK